MREYRECLSHGWRHRRRVGGVVVARLHARRLCMEYGVAHIPSTRTLIGFLLFANARLRTRALVRAPTLAPALDANRATRVHTALFCALLPSWRRGGGARAGAGRREYQPSSWTRAAEISRSIALLPCAAERSGAVLLPLPLSAAPTVEPRAARALGVCARSNARACERGSVGDRRALTREYLRGRLAPGGP